MQSENNQSLQALTHNVGDAIAKDIITRQHAEIQRLNKLVKDLADNQCKCPAELGYSMDTR